MAKIDLGRGMTVELKTVTPLIAADWLTRNDPKNRALRTVKVQAMARDMSAGKWKLTHQGICFDVDGNLIDGQHRLAALVRSATAIPILVFTNASGALSDPIDRNAPRSLSFVAGTDNTVTATCRLLMGLRKGSRQQGDVTVADITECFDEFRESFADLDPQHRRLHAGALAAAIWAMPVNREKVREFLSQSATGEMLKAGDPAYAFRVWKERNSRAVPWEMAMATCNCIRYHLIGKRLAAVFIGEMGYRALTSQRRKMGFSVPDTEQVPPESLDPGTRREGRE